MSSMTIEPTPYFLNEANAQRRHAVAARDRAIKAGDTWLAELLDRRLDDLRDLVRRSAAAPSRPAQGVPAPRSRATERSHS
jgi:hypothetical protein